MTGSVSTILNGLLSFMLEDTSTTGSIITTKSRELGIQEIKNFENSLETSNNEIQNEDRTISAIHDGNLVNRKAQIKLKKDYNTEVNNIRQGTSSSFCYLFIVKVSERIV
ncbi:hypothetical protein HK099_005576 [Clydaea vesicula]|uniref:Uncharacterized protein n=1 Tax=Clydaea vesicula TaxID=447962 RepID=A0AAD5XYC5_9FUNG|nr:hypothetical protein HK099_005576 [Clydaea vesicula]